MDGERKKKGKHVFKYEPVKEPPEDDKIKVILGPAYAFFRRSWREGETPIVILGSNDRGNTLFHLVRIVTKADEKNIEEILKDPYENLGDNLRITLTEVLEGSHPELLIKYYQENTVFVEGLKTDDEKVNEAESVLAECSQIKYKGKKTDEYTRDIDQIKHIKDSYGLPEFYDSDFDDFELSFSSSDSDDDNTVQDLPFKAKVKRSKKKSEDETPKKKVKLDGDEEPKTKKRKKKKEENGEEKTVTEKRKKSKSKTGNEKKCKTVTENEMASGSGENATMTMNAIDDNFGTLRLSDSESD